ncbi:hypothetical protein GMRT_11930 [Giardia muris]|uniref:Uncharacterized protein n=1 Tax=Giardia muris TaxID=5742 RepID=A0A4Z1SRK4_GIAMU|nr:hypothetical protein GMRT_11930 [Giardia muris]|eukprot:TNJ28544.1 hypothetical protein GMRT_11930 [Giardia muris]
MSFHEGNLLVQLIRKVDLLQAQLDTADRVRLGGARGGGPAPNTSFFVHNGTRYLPCTISLGNGTLSIALLDDNYTKVVNLSQIQGVVCDAMYVPGSNTAVYALQLSLGSSSMVIYSSERVHCEELASAIASAAHLSSRGFQRGSQSIGGSYTREDFLLSRPHLDASGVGHIFGKPIAPSVFNCNDQSRYSTVGLFAQDSFAQPQFSRGLEPSTGLRGSKQYPPVELYASRQPDERDLAFYSVTTNASVHERPRSQSENLRDGTAYASNLFSTTIPQVSDIASVFQQSAYQGTSQLEHQRSGITEKRLSTICQEYEAVIMKQHTMINWLWGLVRELNGRVVNSEKHE